MAAMPKKPEKLQHEQLAIQSDPRVVEMIGGTIRSYAAGLDLNAVLNVTAGLVWVGAQLWVHASRFTKSQGLGEEAFIQVCRTLFRGAKDAPEEGGGGSPPGLKH